MTWLLLGASAAILVLAFLLRRHAVKRLAALGLAGEVIYSDNEATDEVLVSHRHGLTGKPDYISREGEELIPVERKSRSVSATGAYEGEILQVAAYCLLVEERSGKPVRRGKILYQNRSIEVLFDDQLRASGSDDDIRQRPEARKYFCGVMCPQPGRERHQTSGHATNRLSRL